MPIFGFKKKKQEKKAPKPTPKPAKPSPIEQTFPHERVLTAEGWRRRAKASAKPKVQKSR